MLYRPSGQPHVLRLHQRSLLGRHRGDADHRPKLIKLPSNSLDYLDTKNNLSHVDGNYYYYYYYFYY